MNVATFMAIDDEDPAEMGSITPLQVKQNNHAVYLLPIWSLLAAEEIEGASHTISHDININKRQDEFTFSEAINTKNNQTAFNAIDLFRWAHNVESRKEYITAIVCYGITLGHRICSGVLRALCFYKRRYCKFKCGFYNGTIVDLEKATAIPISERTIAEFDKIVGKLLCPSDLEKKDSVCLEESKLMFKKYHEAFAHCHLILNCDGCTEDLRVKIL